jgi:cell division protease FtsH
VLQWFYGRKNEYVTIISRGRAGGYVSRLPEYDKSYHTKAEILDNIVISMGGRVAEEIIFGTENITAGASSDIQAATYYAKNMITKCVIQLQI